MSSSGLRFAGLATEFVGTLIVAFSVFLLHNTLRTQPSWDAIHHHKFFRERLLVITGVVFILVGFVLIIVDEVINR